MTTCAPVVGAGAGQRRKQRKRRRCSGNPFDGVWLARRVWEEHPDTVVVLCSSRPHSDVPPDLADLGVVYLNKIDSGQLPALLAHLLATSRSEPTGDGNSVVGGLA